MIRILTLFVALLVPAAVSAWEQTMEWRFSGSEITSVSMMDPDFDEDPALLTIGLSSEQFGATEIVIEADNDIEGCYALLVAVQGNPFETIVLTANLNAQTMNGVTLAQCSFR